MIMGGVKALQRPRLIRCQKRRSQSFRIITRISGGRSVNVRGIFEGEVEGPGRRDWLSETIVVLFGPVALVMRAIVDESLEWSCLLIRFR
jgi:hypothetical protein